MTHFVEQNETFKKKKSSWALRNCDVPLLIFLISDILQTKQLMEKRICKLNDCCSLNQTFISAVSLSWFHVVRFICSVLEKLINKEFIVNL